VKLHTRTEMLDLVVKEGSAVGIVTRDLISGAIESHSGHAVVLATGGYSNVYFLSTNAMACNVSAIWRAHRKGAGFANPSYTQIHPTCIPASDEFQSKLTLMSESLRNDGRIWVPGRPDDDRSPDRIPQDERDYFLERMYPTFGNLVPRDVASRAVKRIVDEGKGVGPLQNGVYLDFHDAIEREGRQLIEERYDNLFEMYHRITDEDPYRVPMRIYPAPHYTMGGLWVDYNLMTTIPGLYAIGEANFSDHGANRLGASALMQGLADGYFVLPITIGDYLAGFLNQAPIPTEDPVFAEARAGVEDRVERFLSARGSRTVDWFHKELGKIMLEYCGMSRSEPGLNKALSEIPALYEEFKSDVRVLGTAGGLNQTLERAGQVDDFFELAQAMCLDALHREESCGGHFREEHQSDEGEAMRRDDEFAHVAVWEWTGDPAKPGLSKEPLAFESLKPSTRSYK
jgi:succinate dehydrogenase / fumarate reductase flavoprotein subunit